ncbi:hypothetical protein CZP2022_142 [Vibrio phage C-ZP2022]|nr:hypothetical protein CZP2022_142 [Vibrio phage C-ZP2022]
MKTKLLTVVKHTVTTIKRTVFRWLHKLTGWTIFGEAKEIDESLKLAEALEKEPAEAELKDAVNAFAKVIETLPKKISIITARALNWNGKKLQLSMTDKRSRVRIDELLLKLPSPKKCDHDLTARKTTRRILRAALKHAKKDVTLTNNFMLADEAKAALRLLTKKES